MKDILQDIVAHTHSLGIFPMIKVTSDLKTTQIDSIAEDRSAIMMATTHSPVEEFTGVFGMPNLDKLNLHLKNPEYKNAKISIVTTQRDGEIIPTHIHFENETGDYKNDYRFMLKSIIEEKLKTVKFKGATWDVVFQPSVASVTRLKHMSSAHSEESIFNVSTVNGNLVFSFGDASTHAGEFVFQHSVNGNLKHTWSWPVSHVQSILNLDGDIIMSISDQGAMMISVDSGMIKYDYILPAQSK